MGQRLKWMMWLCAVVLTLGAGVITGERYGFNIGKLAQPVFGPVWVWLGYGRVETNELLEFGGDQVGQPEPSTPQAVIGAFEGIYSIYEQVGGRRTNFQNVQTYPENSSIRRFSHGVARLDLRLAGSDKARACTAFLISDTYALTAGHCFMRERTCSTSATSSDLVKLKTTKVRNPDGSETEGSAFLVFRQYGNQRTGEGTEGTISVPVKLLNDEIKCEKDLDYAIVKLEPNALQDVRSKYHAEINPLLIGEVPIEGGHQLLILHHPDGRALMATERHCLAADPPKRGEAIFAHYCDTLGGSSGAPVFSRDHEVVVGIHLKSQMDPKTAGEENAAIGISTAVANSKLLQKLNVLLRNPPTSEQRQLIDVAVQRGEQSVAFLASNETTLATYVALDGLERLLGRRDSEYLLTASQVAQNRLAAALIAQTEAVTLGGHTQSVTMAAFSADGSRVVTASRDNTARLWDAHTGAPIGAVMKHDDRVWSAAFSADGSRVVTASEDKTARLWNAYTGAPIGAVMKHERAVYSAAFSADGSRVVTASDDDTARLWNAQSGAPTGAVMEHDGPVSSAAFNADGSRVLTASYDKTARLWDAHTGAPIGAVMKHDDDVLSAAFSADGSRVVTASEDKTARLWDAHTGAPIGAVMKHDGEVWSAAFSADGSRVVTASLDMTARLWDAHTGPPIGAVMKHDGVVNSAAFSADGSRVVTASGKAAQLWDAQSGAPIGAVMKHDGEVNSAAFSADGSRVVTASEDNTAHLWVTGSEDNTAHLWDAHTGAPIGAVMKHDFHVLSASFSADGSRVVTASSDGTARLWDAHTGAPIGAVMKHDSVVSSAALSADGSHVVTASWDKTARLWDAHTGAPIGAVMKHDDWVNSAAFSADGSRVVTASDDKTARLWDARTGAPIGSVMKHYADVSSAAFSADGSRVVTASEDKTARLWIFPPLGACLVDESFRRLQYVRPVQSDCDRYQLRCDLKRVRIAECARRKKMSSSAATAPRGSE